jgi:hypothetical protein
VLDVLLALLGRRLCPWCTTKLYDDDDHRSWFDRQVAALLLKALPTRAFFLYEDAVHRAGGGWHDRFHRR